MGKKSNSKFGDKRLEKGFTRLVESMSVRHTVVLRQLGEGLNENTRFWRFINNEKVTPDRLLAHYWSESTLDFRGKDLLIINDSSTLSFLPHANRKGLGYVGTNTNKEGFDMHPSIVVDAQDAACYGIGGIHFYKKKKTQNAEQEAQKLERRKNCWRLPFEEKERFKWFESPRKAIENCSGASSYTLVGDRESDIYDLIARTLQCGWQYLYRSKQDRKLIQQTGARTLYKLLNKWSVSHTYDLGLPKTKNRSAHTATLELKFGQTSIARPKNNRDNRLADQIELYVVEVKEIPQTVVGKEKPVHWILLTSHPVHTIEDAFKIVRWYRWRWIIEQTFRTLKSKGLDIEKSEVETYHALTNLSTMALIAAVQVMQLVQARDGNTRQKMEQAFLGKEQQCLVALNTKLEGKTRKSKNPHPPDSLAFAAWAVARLGGWSGYIKQKPPGPITFINGLTRFYNILEGYYLIL
jgi:Transposase DDE domain